ncbi:rapamycin-insensitive companion of mTOR isoform X1 [Falco biarmicus]|uniref:rapamycin-insensitive companion of mTOR isoform X1 n=3 Tax=Falco TaxID=8952 RepID=UPI00247887FC|nr:rapamycin-insensitive companion of mTOR isoform X1 [Falco cherrug]XP_055646209.1 rapamycin-insensitive companion of mTOR isoform X1 [Falco peregrinus]XP_056179697.1 rapamycin-insensitive companion of mTOR isoform X1 [Falco biarmicus]
MAVSLRARSLRHLRIRGRNDSGEENVPLDLNREPCDNMREILQNVAKLQGVSNMRKLGHLNNFTKLLCNAGHAEEKLGFTYDSIIICLRLALLNEAKEVRAAGLRALRYLIRDSSILQKVLKLKVDYLIARCIDIQQSNEVERTQALRLVRKMITVNASLFPSSITNSLIAVGNDGLQERDRMVRACIAIICELALQNPEVVALRGGLSTILKNVIDCQLSRINEALITTVLHLINHPKTRQYVRADVELERILAPYTDFHYRHNPDTAEGQLKEDREARFLASKMGIVAAFRSWAGIISLCKPGNSGIQSLIGVLCIPNMEIRRGLLEVLYDIFRLPLPVIAEEFIEALLSVDPSRFQDCWRLSDGFVAAEAKTVLPHRARSRPDLMDNYLALVLSAFITNGLLEGLVEVITSSDDHVSVRATILLGELLHMANTILPHSHSHHLHCLPTLMNMAASFDIMKEKRLRASAALNCLKRFHEMKKRGPKPYSLHLDHIIQKAISTHQKRDQYRVQKDIFILKDTEEALLMNLRDSQVLNHKENLDWNWNLIGTILKWPNVNLRNYKDEQLHRFVRRLLYFYKPSSKLYANLDLDYAKAKQLTVVGCQFTEFLLESEEDGQGYLEELVKDIVHWLNSSSGMKPERSLQNNGLLNTLSQHYFLFFGTLSCHPHGVKMLEKCNVFQCLLNLCSLKNQDHLLKLTVSSLDYSRDGLARVILSKILTAATDSCRLYATKHLRVLLRANVEFFSNWGIELLVTQLHDKNKSISSEALDILDEACEDKANLHALIQMKPALSHLGDKGLLLLLRFLSIPKGFSYLNERGYVTKQMEKWQKEYNLKYVELIEEQLNEALTTYRKPVDGDNYVRRSNQRLQRPHVYLPVHLYGQLVHHKTGCHLLESQSVVTDLSYTVRSPMLDKWEGIKQLKAALWALGNIGSSNWGLNLLQEENVIPDIMALAQHCEVLSVRGTCVYVLGLIAKTKQGCDILKHHNWDAVRHSRRQPWPVVPDDMEQLCNELSSIPSTLSLNSESTSSRHNSESESAPSSMFIMEEDRFGGTSTSTFFLDITEDAEQIFCDRPGPSKDKDRSPFPFFSSSRLVKNRILNSLTLPNKKHRSGTDPKGAKLTSSDNKSVLRRNRTVTEPASSIDFPAGEEFNPVFRVPKIQTLRLETSFVGSKHVEDTDSTPSIGENDLKLPKGLGNEIHRENTSRERLIGDGTTQTHFKSRSLSFNTDTTTSGISSMSSSPSRETVGVDTTNVDTDYGSLSTVVSTKTVKPSHCSTPHSNHLPLSKSNSVSLVLPGSSHTLPRRAQSLKAPSLATIKSLADYNFSYTSSRDAFGYATLKRLQQQRMHPSLSHSEALASPAKDVLFTDTITMKSGSLDSRLTPSRFMKALSYASLDKEDLLSPINQNTLQRSSSVRSMVSNATFGSSDDYIGLALPVDINEIFQVKETPYFQKKTTPPFDDRGARVFAPDAGGLPSGTSDVVKSPFQMLRQQISLTEIMNTSRSDASQFLENMEDTGLQEHTDENCLYCVCIQIVGYQPNNKVNSSYSRTDFSDIPYTDWCGQTIHNHLDVHSSKFSGISGCSDAVSHGSASSTKSTELVLGVKSIPDDTPVCRILLRKEVLRLVINLSSSVGTKGHETGLLTIKEKYPQAFDDICLYSEVSYLLAHCTFRLPSRRFIQELFQDVQFLQMHEEAEAILATPTKQPVIDTSAES